MLYVRKLSKKSSLYKIRDTSLEEVEADVLKQELGTSRNTLSFWKCDDMSHLPDTMKAIILSTTSIETSQFIIVDDKLLNKYGISIDETELGVTGYKGFDNLHVNFCDLNYEKIGAILNMIREISSDKSRIPELKRGQVKSYIEEVRKDGLLDEDAIRPELKDAIDRYCPLIA